MKTLTILVPEGENNLSSIVGSYKIFSRANDYYRSLGKKAVFDIKLAGLSREVNFYNGLFSAHPIPVEKIKKSDLIIIPSLNHNYVKSVEQNKPLIEWIGKQHKKGAQVASICTGAFLLASTGILNQKSCSTHWLAADSLKKMFPAIQVVADQVITDEQGIYTNGGAYSFLNLILYLVEKYYDRKTALFCAKVFQIDIERSVQSPFMIFSGLKNHTDETIKKAQSFIERSSIEKLNFQKLASKFALGRRNFDRRFKKATSHTPLEYHQKVRIEMAKRSLENTSKTITEVMMNSGYSDSKAFREVFRKITGLSPQDYRNKFNKKSSLR